MGWSLGYHEGRWIGYGVPAICDQPDCGKEIDRGLSYRCGDLGDEGCNQFFCGEHLSHVIEGGPDDGVEVCERCAGDLPPFDPTPDTDEWVTHVLTDESWQQWRDENPEKVSAMREQVGA